MSYIIDGHNLIGKMGDLRLDDPDDEQKLIYRLHVFAQRAGQRLTVVFDPGQSYVPAQKPAYQDVRALYAKAGHTADRVILHLVKAAPQRRELIVVTSDRGLAGQARAAGARVLSSEEFLLQMRPTIAAPDSDEAEEEERAEAQISPAEVEAWLAEFRAAQQKKQQRRLMEKKQKAGR